MTDESRARGPKTRCRPPRAACRRDAAPAGHVRQEVEARYAGRVAYVEVSAALNQGLAELLAEALRRTLALPARRQISAARERAVGRHHGPSLGALVERAHNLRLSNRPQSAGDIP